MTDAERSRQLIERHHRRVAPSLLRPLMYCWLKPDTSASCSRGKPLSRLIRPTFRTTGRLRSNFVAARLAEMEHHV